MLLSGLPGLVLLVLPGLGRAFGAVFLRETGGSAPVALVFETLRALGALRERRDRSFVPLTRSAFWERLGRAGRGRAVARRHVRLPRPAAAPHVGRRAAALRRPRLLERRPGAARARAGAGSSTRIASSRSASRRRPASRRLPPRPPTRTPRRFSRRCGASGTRSTRASRGSPACSSADVQARAFDHRGGPRGRPSRRRWPRRLAPASSAPTC